MGLTLDKLDTASMQARFRGCAAKHLALHPSDAFKLNLTPGAYYDGMLVSVTEEVPVGQFYITDFNLLDSRRQAIRPAQAYGLGLAGSAEGHHSPETPAAPDRYSPLGCGRQEGSPVPSGSNSLLPSEGATPLLTGHNNAV